MLQSKTTQVYFEIIPTNIGYQYDSRDGEIFLEEGYKYVLINSVNNLVIKTTVDLTETHNAN